MPTLHRTVNGGYTRHCPECGLLWAVASYRTKEDPCPECGYVAEAGEQVFNYRVCPGCGKKVRGSNPPVKGFPGQRYCSAECADLF